MRLRDFAAPQSSDQNELPRLELLKPFGKKNLGRFKKKKTSKLFSCHVNDDGYDTFTRVMSTARVTLTFALQPEIYTKIFSTSHSTLLTHSSHHYLTYDSKRKGNK